MQAGLYADVRRHLDGVRPACPRIPSHRLPRDNFPSITSNELGRGTLISNTRIFFGSQAAYTGSLILVRETKPPITPMPTALAAGHSIFPTYP